jgi:hypothetical protein
MSKAGPRRPKAARRTCTGWMKSDCAVQPVNQSNKGGQPSAEIGEGRAQMRENIAQPHMRPTQSEKRMSQGLDGVRKAGAAMLVDVPVGASPTGGACSVTTVVIPRPREGRPTRGKLGSKSLRWLAECLVRSARGASNSTGRSESEPGKPRKAHPIGSG